MKKAVVFGIGRYWKRYASEIKDEYEIIAFADNDACKQGLLIDGKPVLQPCAIPSVDYDAVVITLTGGALEQVKNQLLSLEIDESRIVAYEKQIGDFLIDAMFFTDNLTDAQKRKLFKNNVELVSLELNSQCNRQCWMCTNSVLDRHSENKKLPRPALEKVLSELREIHYNCDISLSVFNEPMLNDNLDESICLIKSYLPDAPIHFNTNGDYLTAERLEQLEKLGLDFLPVSLYVDTPEKPWTRADAEQAIEKAAKRLGVAIDAVNVQDNTMINAVCRYKSLPVLFRCANHRIVAGDRCGSVPEDAPVRRFKKVSRICDRTFTQFTVNHTGAVTLCSNFHPDFVPHEPYICGNVEEKSIFDIYTSRRWTEFRRRLIGNIESMPCCTCGIVSGVWGDTSLSLMDFQPFRDRPRYRKQ